MIKDLFSDLFNQRAIDAIKSTVFERLWILALSMKDKTRLAECGTILNKSAAGEDYKWGLRFYILLLECFRQWTVYTEDQDFSTKFARLKEAVPVVEDEIYYPQVIINQVLDHSKADALMSGFKQGKTVPAPAPSYVQAQPTSHQGSIHQSQRTGGDSRQAVSQPPELQELEDQKRRYFEALFTKTPNVAQISEGHMILQSLYDAYRNKLAALQSTQNQKNDITFYRKFSNLHLTESIESPKGIAKLRADICALMTECYGSYPGDYDQYLSSNSRSNSQTKPLQPQTKLPSNVFMAAIDNDFPEAREPPMAKSGGVKISHQRTQESRRPQPARSVSPNNYEFDLKDDHSDQEDVEIEKIKRENKVLQKERESLRDVVGVLREKEKTLSQSMMMKSSASEVRRIDATPDLLIDEIERKNREYEQLQAKYQSLILQMNDRMKNDVDRSINGISRISHRDESGLGWNPRTFDSGRESRFLRHSKYSDLSRL
jgi:hypothetical protein